MDNNFGEIIALIVAIVLTVVFFKYILVVVGILVVLVAIYAVAVYLRKKRKQKEIVGENITRGDVDEYIKECTLKIQNLRRYYYKLKDDDMRKLLDEVTKGLQKTNKILKDDPSDLKIIRRFMNITLPSCDKILSQSAQIYTIENPNEKSKKALEESKQGLEMISIAITNQINKLFDNNVMDIEVEIKVLKKTLLAKGLLNEEKENEDNE